VTEAQAARVRRPPQDWSIADVCAYIAEEIVRAHGPQLPARDVQSALEGFCARFGIIAAVRIARAAFEVYGGMWEGAPVTWRRFTPGHDLFFARPILTALS
jgi:hypothetical protein